MPEELTDAQLVDLLRSDRTAGFDLLYRRYAQRLFAYSVTVVRDRAAAEDATHESLMAAVAKIDKLRNPEQLRSWLFAITRNRCLTTAGERSRFTDSSDALDMIPVDDDPTAGLAQQDSAALVNEALAGLAPADRDALALALRHDLDMADVALAMGSNQPTARARISRAKAALTGSVTGLLLARDSADSQAPKCEGLQQALAGFTGEWTPLIRKRVAKHAKSCAQCDERGNKRAIQYVSAFTVPVALILAPQARARADEGLATLDADGAGEWLTWGSDGFPKTAVEGGRRAGLLLAGAAGVALLLIGLVTWQVNAEPPVAQPSAPVTATPTPSPTDTRSPSPSQTAEKQDSKRDQQSSAPQTEAPKTTASAQSQPSEEPQPKDEPASSKEPGQDPTPTPEPKPTKDPKTEPEPAPEPEPEPEPTKPTEPEPEPTKPTAPEPRPEPTKPTAPEPQPEPVPTKPTAPQPKPVTIDPPTVKVPDEAPTIK